MDKMPITGDSLVLPEPIKALATCSDYRKLRPDEVETLRAELSDIDKDIKIKAEEMDQKKSKFLKSILCPHKVHIYEILLQQTQQFVS